MVAGGWDTEPESAGCRCLGCTLKSMLHWSSSLLPVLLQQLLSPHLGREKLPSELLASVTGGARTAGGMCWSPIWEPLRWSLVIEMAQEPTGHEEPSGRQEQGSDMAVAPGVGVWER